MVRGGNPNSGIGEGSPPMGEHFPFLICEGDRCFISDFGANLVFSLNFSFSFSCGNPFLFALSIYATVDWDSYLSVVVPKNGVFLGGNWTSNWLKIGVLSFYISALSSPICF